MNCKIFTHIFGLQRYSGCLSRCSAATINISSNHLLSSQQQFPVSSHSFSVATTAVSVFTLVFLRQRPQLCDLTLKSNTRRHSCNVNPDPTRQGSESIKEEKVKPQRMSKSAISDKLKAAKAEAVWGLFVADAVAMPVHWFYDPRDIKKDYGGWLKGYIAPNGKHPSSILRLSAVGMNAGDNTLNAVMALHELKTMNRFDHDLIKPERDVRGAVLEDYVKFMTTPGSHNDTYAESFHRSYFRDWILNGKPTSAKELLEFSENRSKKMIQERPDHQLAVIGSLVPAIPWIIRNAHKTEKDCAQSTVDFVKLTHPVPSLIPFVECYARLLHAVINGKDLKSEIMIVLGHSILGGPANRDMMVAVLDALEKFPKGSEERLKQYQNIVSTLGSACYIEGALNSMLFLALEFHNDFEAGVLANANCGGENCHRGAALGALLAAVAANQGSGVPAKFKDGLHSLRPLIQEVVQDMNAGF